MRLRITIILTVIGFAFLPACMTTKSGLETGYDSSMQTYRQTNPNAAATMDGLFRNRNGGMRVPTSGEMNRAISNPGSIQIGCGEQTGAEIRRAYNNDPRYQVSLKNYDGPSRGCIDANKISNSQADDLITSQGLSTVGATNKERRVLAASIKRVQQLNGGPLEEGMGAGRYYPFVYRDRNGSAQKNPNGRYPSGYIQIGRNTSRGHKHYGHSAAQHVHEWGHLIGNQGGYEALKSYMSRSYGKKDYCKISNYAMSRNNEQFAEVLTAFVTDPSSLLNNTRTPGNCKKVYNFFKDVFFKKGNRVKSCH